MKIKAVKFFHLFVATSVLLFAATALRAQSLYSNAVMNLNPVAYWPLQEKTQPPSYDTETNLGSFGSIANAYYVSVQAQATNVGAISGDGDGSRNFLGNANSFALVPTTDNRVSLPPGQPFTVECWARATGNQSYVAIVNQQGGPNNAGGLNGSTNSSGWALCQNFATYRGTYAGNNPACFSFHVFNGIGFTGGGECEVSNSAASGQWLAGGSSGYENSWVYLCGVFDGTNCWLYMFSTNLTAAYSGTNAMSFQIPVTTGPAASGSAAGSYGSPVPGATFSPDTWDPIQFACTRGLGANPYHGWMDEVAIYTNALTFLQISNHFNAGTNGLGNYKATILADNPAMYWRMDAPKWTPVLRGYPVAKNYGSAASSMINLNTDVGGPNSGVYQPGTVPGAPGPSYAGFGALTNACAFNGLVGAVDVGYNSLLDPIGVTNNFTLVAWFRANPMDYTVSSGRWNAMLSHSDSSWKAQFRGGTVYGYKGAGSQPTVSPGATFNANDGKWHMYVLESSYVNGVGTNVTIYLDSGLISATAAVPNPIPGKPTLDGWIGGAPDAGYIEPTNEATYNTTEQYFAGEVAHVAYFTNALTLNQIQTLFFSGETQPAITRQPISGTGGLYGAYTNTVTAVGAPPLSYQWYTNGLAINGATNASLIINPVAISNAGTNYYVVITNSYGAVTSSVVSLTIASNLMFTAQYPITYVSPMTLYGGQNVGGTNFLGSTPTFQVSVLGAMPISYQWSTNGVPMGGATNASLTFTNCQLTSPTTFACLITNAYGSISSAAQSVSYLTAPMAPFPQKVLAAQPIGYWRLNEPDDGNYDGNPGAICNDYESGNNGIYTNVYLSDFTAGSGYSSTTDPNEKSAEFGFYTSSAGFAGMIGTNVNFATPAGGNAEFTVAIWANGNSTTRVPIAGLVTKGHYSAEQFTLDEGATGNDVRFGVRDAVSGNYYSANSSINLGSDSFWHYIVGICNETNGQLLLYIDGQLAGTGTLPVGNGILDAGMVSTMIGARDNGTAPGGAQFRGFLNDAAIYNYALSSNQIVAQYNVSGILPFFTHQPLSSTNIDQGANATISATAAGSGPLSYQWFDVNANSYMVGQTNATLVISNAVVSDSYYLTVTSGFGSTNSATASVDVQSGGPQISTEVQTPFYANLGGVASNSIFAYGTLPLAYQWQFSNNGSSNWVNLADNGRISGSQNNALTISSVQPSDLGYYQAIVGNTYNSATSSVAQLVIIGLYPVTFYNNTTNGWTTSGGASFANGVLTLTSTTGNGAFFFQVPQYVGAFQASFTYQAQSSTTYPLADGVTFCLQDDSRGPAATGSAGGSLGYAGIAPSVALELNIFPGNGVGGTGFSFDANGGIGPNTPPGSVNLTNGLVDVSINYANGQLALAFSNELSAATFSTNLYVGDITQVLGSDTAYVGFTGAFGADTSVQTISNFKFVSIPPQAIQMIGTNAVIAWPGAVPGYTLQENSNLNTTNWVNVTNSGPSLMDGLNMMTVPVGSSNEFYRLVLPLQ